MIKDGIERVYRIDDKTYHCGIDVTMSFIGGKWKCVVMWYLKNGTLRFSELKKFIPDITEKMLSIQLKSLESDKLIKRKVYGHKPPIRVQYTLTEFGESLITVIGSINNWGIEYGKAVGQLMNKE